MNNFLGTNILGSPEARALTTRARTWVGLAACCFNEQLSREPISLAPQRQPVVLMNNLLFCLLLLLLFGRHSPLRATGILTRV